MCFCGATLTCRKERKYYCLVNKFSCNCVIEEVGPRVFIALYCTLFTFYTNKKHLIARNEKSFAYSCEPFVCFYDSSFSC